MGFAPATRVFAGTPGEEFPRLVRLFGNGQLAARRDGLAARPGDRRRFHDAPRPAFRSRSGIRRRHLQFRHTPGCFGRRRDRTEYSFTCAGGSLPSGMGFAPETRVIAGTPGEAFRDSCVYSVGSIRDT